MAGGTFTAQNKVRAGAYINNKGIPTPQPDTDRGIVLLIDGAKHDWGNNGVIELDASSNVKALLGADLTDDTNKALNETLKEANKVLYLNLNDGTKASYADDTLPFKFTAKYPGSKGNNITIDVIKALDSDAITVKYILDTVITSTQTIHDVNDLLGDEYVDVELADNAADKLAKLSGEHTYKLANGSSKYADDITSLVADSLDTRIFNVVTTAGYPVESNIHKLVAQLVTDLRAKQGYHVTAVVPGTNNSNYDNEAVSTVVNGVILDDGTELDRSITAGYVAGASASVPFNQSLTYHKYPKAVDTMPRLSNQNIIQAIQHGQIVFSNRKDGSVVIEQDINSLIGYTDDKPKYFAKNRVIRTLDYIDNDTKEDFENNFIGKVSNTEKDRDLFKASRIKFLRGLQDSGIIVNFNDDDIAISAGADKDTVLVNLKVQPTDSIEKLYMTVTVS